VKQAAAPGAVEGPVVDSPEGAADDPPPVAAPPAKRADPPATAPPAKAPPAPIELTDGLPDGLEGEEAPASPEELRQEEQARAVADGIRFVLRAHRAQVVACYERAFKDEQRSPGGRVTVDFTIATDGKAKGIHTSANSTGKEPLAKCLEQRIAEWEFPKPPDGDFRTSYPFVFSAGT
jgi:hypothetical protein